MDYTYKIMHIPTGKIIECKVSVPNTLNRIYTERDFFVALNNWNRLGEKLWKYWV